MCGWNLHSKGHIADEFQTTGDTRIYIIDVIAAGTIANGDWPVMEVYVDSLMIGNVAVSDKQLQTYQFFAELAEGTHVIKIAFNNDFFQPEIGVDRNLIVNQVVIHDGGMPLSVPGNINALDISVKSRGEEKTGQEAWNLYSNGFLGHTVAVTHPGQYEIVVTASGKIVKDEPPFMAVKLNGMAVDTVEVASREPAKYRFPVSLDRGLHFVQMEFLNDLFKKQKGLDRNLILHGLAVEPVVVPLPNITVSTSVLDFGDVPMDSGKTLTMLIGNSGTMDLVLSSIELQNDSPNSFSADFGSFPVTIQAGENYALAVYFKPDTIGIAQGTLLIHSNDPDNATMTIQLKGTGVQPHTGSHETTESIAADFTVDKTFGTVPLTVKFTNLSKGYQKCLWDFGDGTTSTEDNPVHTYQKTDQAKYTVTLTVTGTAGEAKKTRVDLIVLQLPPQVVNTVPDTAILEDSRAVVICPDLTQIFRDLNGDSLVYNAASNNPAVRPIIESNALKVTVEENYWGEAQIYVQASDGYFSTADTFTVKIAAVNDPPGAFTRLSPKDGSTLKSTKIDFRWSTSEDVDGDAVTYLIRLWTETIDTTFSVGDTLFSINLKTLAAQLPYGKTIFWSVKATDGSLITEATNGEGQFKLEAVTSVTESDGGVPNKYVLYQNYPNPFNPETTIRFDLPEHAQVKLEIYDARGVFVRRLLSKLMPAGTHSIVWDGKDATGKNVSSGLYFVKLSTGQYVLTRQMILMK